MTPQDADEILEAHDIEATLENGDEVEHLQRHNPRLLEAYRALVRLAYE